MNGVDENGNPLSPARLGAEGVLLILAGSDTSSACKSPKSKMPASFSTDVFIALAGTLFYLMQQPQCLKKLREEIDRTFDNVDDIRLGNPLTGCVYLRACIDEALRMASAGPGISERTVLKVRIIRTEVERYI